MSTDFFNSLSMEGKNQLPSLRSTAPEVIIMPSKRLSNDLVELKSLTPKRSSLSPPTNRKDVTLRDSNSNELLVDEPLPLEDIPLDANEKPRDGDLNFEKKIDFVLVYSLNTTSEDKHFVQARQAFELNLIAEGLLLDKERHRGKFEDLVFVKIHAPWKVLCHYAEIMNLKMPIKCIEPSRSFKDRKAPFMAPYSQGKDFLFDIPPVKEEFFTTAQRSQIVDFILARKGFSEEADHEVGIHRLLHEGVYSAAYPLHEGKLEANEVSPRMHLLQNWASVFKAFSRQPLDEIKEYFGVKIALYFSWLGFYTSMLIPASIVGLICFFYGLLTVKTDATANHVCSKDFDHTPMCPLCGLQICHFFNISHACGHIKLAYLFDNPATVFYAIFMAFWSTVYIEMWKRYFAKLTYKWDLSTVDVIEECPRPEFLARASQEQKTSLSPTTKTSAPQISFWKQKFPRLVFSLSVMLLLISVSFAFVLAIIVCRVSLRAKLSASKYHSLAHHAASIAAFSAATLNLIVILILNHICGKVAHHLTEMEMPRTQAEHDNSMTLKLYTLEFVNYYSSLFYMAFFKGRSVTYPGDLADNEGHLASLVEEDCGTGGCLVELSHHLAIILVGEQAFNAVWEMSVPWIQSLKNRRKLKTKDKDVKLKDAPQWKLDFPLIPWDPHGLFEEYLEMVVQFGLVTIFAVAFPLAPLFALINNAFEIRLDAKKMLTTFRRPVAERVKNIGVWYRILDSIGKLAVFTNALIIAFTSDFIPKLYHYSKYGSLDTFLNSTLSYYESSNFERFHLHVPDSKLCMYHGHRHPPNSGSETYTHTQRYWEELGLKLAFVIIFENVIASLTMLLAWLIPDTPRSVKIQMKQHAYIRNRLIIEHEAKHAKESSKE